MKTNNKNIYQDLLLGIDIGTTGAKCTFYDFKGRPISSGYQEYRMIHPKIGYTEQDPQKWWNAVKENIILCIENDGLDTGRVAAIAVSSTNAVMLMGKDNKIIYNGIGLHDQRADAQVAWLQEHVGNDLVFNITGNNIAKGSFALPTLRWFIDERPDLIDKTDKFLIPNGFIIKMLTGEYSIDLPRSGLTLLNDLKRGTWSDIITTKAQIPESILPPIYSSTSIVGEVTKQASRSTGLKVGTPVVAGAIDTIAATIGAGAVNPGDCAITIGSSGRLCQICEKPIFNKKVLSTPGALNNQFAAVQTTDNAGISLKWFRDTFGKMVLPDALSAGITIYDQLNRLCTQSKPCSNGLIYLPYLSGEKSPIWNPQAKGVFFGINLDTSYSDFIRAVMEGVAFSIRHCIETVQDSGIKVSEEPIPIGGGVAKSDVWCQIFANVLNKTIIQLQDDETETLGDVILAAQSLNKENTSINLGKELALKGKLKKPQKQYIDMYNSQFGKYKDLYLSMKHLF